MASITDHGDGLFTVRWRDPDGRTRKQQFGERGQTGQERRKSKEAAEQFRAARRRDEQSKVRFEVARAAAIPSLEHAMIEHAMHLRDIGMAESTIKNREASMVIFARFLGDPSRTPVTGLSLDMLKRFYKFTGEEKGITRTLDTRAKIVSHIELMWKSLANSDKYAAIIPMPRKLERLPSDPGQHTEAPTWEQMDAAIAAGVNEGGAWYPIVMAVLRSTGLRISQVLGLKVKDVRVDALGNVDLDFRGELGKTKSERKGRRVPIAASVSWLFTLLTKDRAPEAWLVPDRPSPRSAKHMHARPRAVRTERVRDAWAAAKVPESIWAQRPDHCFRKGFVSGLRALGAERDAVEYLVGHSLGLAGVYSAAFAFGLRDAVKRMPPFSDAARAVITKSFHLVTDEKEGKA